MTAKPSSVPLMKVKDLLDKGKDDQYARLQGKLVSHKGGEEYEFADQSGKITRCLGASCSRLPVGKCIPDLKEGQPCADPSAPTSQNVDEAECEFPLECIGGKCTRLAETKCQ